MFALGAGIALLLIALLIIRWAAHAKPGDVYAFLRAALLVLLVAGTIALVLSGRLMWALGLLPVWLFWALRMLIAARGLSQFWRMWRNSRVVQGLGGGGDDGSTGQVSEVETRFLQMRLDHDSGDMDGMVKEGRQAGRRLSDMDLPALLALHVECLEDGDSLRLLESYLDREHGDTWRDHLSGGGESSGPAVGSGAMTEAAAWKILDLEPGATDTEIKAAHRRLMSKLHPDHGGSSYLAAQINQARDLLMKTGGGS